jgi:hypothetical protein
VWRVVLQALEPSLLFFSAHLVELLERINVTFIH